MSEVATQGSGGPPARRQANVNVRFISSKGDDPLKEIPASKVEQAVDEVEQAFDKSGAIEPPYDPGEMVRLWENSNSLRQNVDAYAQNIDGFGHRFEPVFDLDDDEADEKIGDALWQEQRAQALAESREPDLDYEPSAKEIAETRVKIKRLARRELALLRGFFDFASPDRSFVDLRKQTRQDTEIIGHGYWEVLRSMDGEIAQFVYVPSYTVRGVKPGKDGDLVSVDETIRRSPLSFGKRKIHRKFRRWVQIVPPQTVRFFKEFGDTRLISNVSGGVFKSEAAMREQDGDEAEPATELIQFRVHSPRSGYYGVPRWIGNYKSVLGSIKAESINLLFFDNKTIPPMVVLVSGGSIGEAAEERLRDYIKHEIKGEENFHKMLIIEGVPSDNPGDPMNPGRVKVEIKPLTQFIQSDALFMKYDANNRDKVGESMRNPKIVRGDTRDFNRATAQAALEFVESQVYHPERQSFDWWINRFILPELGIRFWTFRSNSPVSTDLEAAVAIERLTKVGLLTPAEGRMLAERVFNIDLPKINEDWVKQPLQLTLAGVLMNENGSTGGEGGTGEPQRNVEAAASGHYKSLVEAVKQARSMGRSPVEDLAQMLQLRDGALEKDRVEAAKEIEATRDALATEPERIEVSWSDVVKATEDGDGAS